MKLGEHQMCGSKQCPSCGHQLERKPGWLGLPAGVKFDPTDQELIEHLEAKVESKAMKSHPLIDEFVPTIEGEDGICYTHPEKLPGVSRDGLSRHFFHRPSKAYTTGTRKRRKIQTECDTQGGGETRWHKTGKTRPVTANGKQKGCKKILVLYTNFGKNRKPEKTNWVMHQYHLGQLEEEKEGEFVVSKIFYQTQPRQCNLSDRSATAGEGSIDPSGGRRDTTGSGSCSSSKEVIAQREIGISSYSSMDIQQMKSDHFSFDPFGKSFDEVGMGEASKVKEASASHRFEEHEEHQHHRLHHMTLEQQQQQQQHHHHQAATTAFNFTRTSHPISTIISSPSLHQTSINVLNEDPYNVSRVVLQNESFQQQQQQQQHNMGGRSASVLEDLIMNCTSAHDIKEESSMTNPQEAEWLKYPTFWPDDPGNPDHHG